MAGLTEVPTDDLLTFQDYPTTHAATTNSNNYRSAQINVNIPSAPNPQNTDENKDLNDSQQCKYIFSCINFFIYSLSIAAVKSVKSFWTLDYYQRFFDVDTKDVTDRIIASVVPKQNNSLKLQLKQRPDLYGPFWIAVTLIFTIAISGNVANYLQHASQPHHWKYDFHLVSYAATAIFLYVTLVPITLWGLLKWSSEINDLDGLEQNLKPNVLELICIYGYSLFIYIPTSVLWTIQIGWLQWLLVTAAALTSGSVLLFTTMPSLKLSRHKYILIVGIIVCHLLLAAGFMLYFFHVPNSDIPPVDVVSHSAKVVENKQ